MHDQYARRAALDSSPDDEQHELFTCRRTLRQRSHPVGYFEDKLQQEVLENEVPGFPLPESKRPKADFVKSG